MLKETTLTFTGAAGAWWNGCDLRAYTDPQRPALYWIGYNAASAEGPYYYTELEERFKRYAEEEGGCDLRMGIRKGNKNER